jgi:hypothetical protein
VGGSVTATVKNRIAGEMAIFATTMSSALPRENRFLRLDECCVRPMGENGRAWVESEMNWTRAADEFEQAVERFFPRVFFGIVFSGDKEAV